MVVTRAGSKKDVISNSRNALTPIDCKFEDPVNTTEVSEPDA